jgi:hypothetical protein
LHGGRVARIEGRISDHEDLVTIRQLTRVLKRNLQNRMIGTQAIDLEDGHIPIGMDHKRLLHERLRLRGAVQFAEEIHVGLRVRQEFETPIAKTAGEDLGDMTIRHQEPGPDDEARAGVGISPVSGQTDPANGRNDALDPRSQLLGRGQFGP